MISLVELQNKYIELYSQLRKYIWDYDVAEQIAELEIATYKAFPDIVEVRGKLDRLSRDIRNVRVDDEDLQKAFDNFYELLDASDSIYYKLTSAMEGSLI